jgi:glycosyltransferase involved in cell wall biosynthesis
MSYPEPQASTSAHAFSIQPSTADPDLAPVPRRVLYLHATSEIGGSDVSLVRIIETLDRRRFQPLVALPADGPLVERLRRAACPVFFVPGMKKLTTRRGRLYFAHYALTYPAGVAEIARLIRREAVDIVHTNTIHNLHGFMAALVAGRPHVWHVREIVWQSRALRSLERLLAGRLSSRTIVTSDAVGGMFRNRRGAVPSGVRTISNGVDLSAFNLHHDGRSVRRDLGLPDECPVAGIVCRLDRWKGVDTFLRAAALCRADCPDARFVVVGGPIEGQEAYEHELKALSRSLDLDDAVVWTGWRFQPADMPRVHAALSVLVLASRHPEPFGLVLLEAMASGKPVVATRHGGPMEICVNGETGLLVPPEDTYAMAVAMTRLLSDQATASTMGQAGRKRVEERFSQTACVKQIQGVYDEL